MTGPLFGFSDTWQLVINTGTTIVTFLMVFLIQNTQNRDSQALQLKVDELIRATKGAHVALMDMEELSDRELASIKRAYLKLAAKGREDLARRARGDTSQRRCPPRRCRASCSLAPMCRGHSPPCSRTWSRHSRRGSTSRAPTAH